MSLAKKPAALPEVHKILARAMMEAGEAAWPPHPHLGGPLPVLSNATQLAIGIDLATSLRVPGDELYGKRLAAARRVAAGESIPNDQLDAISKSATKDAVAARISKLVARAALNHLYAPPSARNIVGYCVENLAIAGLPEDVDAARLPPARRRGDPAMRAGRHPRRAQARRDRADQAGAVARGSTKGFALAFAELANGTYGLCVKLKARWQWHEGDRATAFAMVPDELMRHVAADIDPDFKKSSF